MKYLRLKNIFILFGIFLTLIEIHTEIFLLPAEVRKIFGFPPWSSTIFSLGTGFFVNSEGYAVTNAHVIHSCKQILASNKIFMKRRVRVLYESKDIMDDIAVIKVEVQKNNFFYFSKDNNSDKIDYNFSVIGFYGINGNLIPDEKIVSELYVLPIDNDTKKRSEILMKTNLERGSSGSPVITKYNRVYGMISKGFYKENKKDTMNYVYAIYYKNIEKILSDNKINYSYDNFQEGNDNKETKVFKIICFK